MTQAKMLALSVLSVCFLFTGSNPAFADTLYDRLGGKQGITAIVDDFVSTCAHDPRIKSFFAKTAADPKRLAKFKGNLVDQLCQLAGGPCKYNGKDMKTAHAGMGIGGRQYDDLVMDLGKSLVKFKVAGADRHTLITALSTMKGDIIESKAARASGQSASAKDTAPATETKQ